MGRWAIVNTILGVIVLLLGLQIAWTWSRSLPPVETAAHAPEDDTKGEAHTEGKAGTGRRGAKRAAEKEKVEQQPVVLVTAIVNKDLFDPSRQRPTEEAKAPPPAKEIGPPPSLGLVGVRMVGNDREAIIADAAQGNQHKRMRIGDQAGGYTLKTIQASRVTLTSAAGDVINLAMSIEKIGGAAPKPPGVPVPPARPGQPGQPGQSPAAGVQPPQVPAAPGIQPRLPRAAIQQQGQPGRPGVPPVPGTPPVVAAPGVPGMPQTSPAAGVQAAPPPGVPAIPPGVLSNPNLAPAIRQKLEQLKAN